MNKLFILFITFVFIAGCGGGDDNTTEGTESSENTENMENTEGTESTESNDPPSQRLAEPFVSPATVTTETAFNDTYVQNNVSDIAWKEPSASAATSIDWIAFAFNEARKEDPSVKEALRMPQQAVWDSYSTSVKVLYLINSERSARGMRPLRGVAPELETSANNYAEELADSGEFSHNFGTYANPTTRLAGWANVKAPPQTTAPDGSENTTYNTYYIEEMISFESGSTINEHEARAIYRFMYEDKSPDLGGPYAHRKIILVKDPASAVVPSSITVNNAEPLIGASSADGANRNTLVIHGIDPNDEWDINNLIDPPELIGPEEAQDCLSGATLNKKANSDGINTSTCE